MADEDQCFVEEEKEQESSAESEPEASGDSDDGDDDRDFNIGQGTMKNHVKGLMVVEGTTLRPGFFLIRVPTRIYNHPEVDRIWVI